MAPIDEITAALRAAIAGAIADAQAELDAIAKDAGTNASGGLFSDVQGFTSVLGDLGSIISAVADVLAPELGVLKVIEDGAGKLGNGFGLGYLMGYVGWQFAQPLMLPIVHAINASTTNEIYDPDTAAQLVAKGIISQSFGQSESSGGGLDNPHFDNLVTNAYNLPGLAELLELWRRGVIDGVETAAALVRNGYDPNWLDNLAALKRQLLSPADLALANLRGNIDDTTMQGYADQLGVTSADMAVLIGNTGEPPGLMQLLEAYRRGFIDKPTLEHGIRQSRVRDEWIPTIEQLRYEPMSTADTVRAVIENYLTSDEGQVIAQQNGLDPQHWPILVEAYGRPLAHEQMRVLVNRGVATREQFDQAMRESDIKDKYIDLSWEVGQRLIPERMIVTAVHHGSITSDEATSRLQWLGYSDADIQLLLSLGSAEGKTAKHALTRADVVSLYEDGKMPRDEALSRLVTLGYSNADATDVLEIADLKAAATALRTQERAIEASFKAHHLSAQQAQDQLISAGVTPAQATSLLDQWTTVRGRPTKELTEAQILKLGENNIISASETENRLIAYGLSQSDADLLLKLHGIGQQPAAG